MAEQGEAIEQCWNKLSLKDHEDEESIYKSFLQKNKVAIAMLRQSLEGSYNCRIRWVKIDAADINFPQPFSSSTILFGKDKSGLNYRLRTVFKKAYNVLDAYFSSDPDDPILPEDPNVKRALELLLRFVMNSEKVWNALYEGEKKGEWNWTLRLAQHVFTQLSLYPKYKYDISKDYRRLGCPCLQGDKILGERDDTSFGWENGWHGKVDILMAGIPVYETAEKGEESSQLFKTDSESSISCENKDKGTTFSYREYGQIGAETISFSFLKNRDKNNDISMIPSIAVTKELVQIHFYDSINDIFLQSGPVKLSAGSYGEDIFSFPATLLIWLAVNYNLFYTGIEGLPKSGLHELINVEKLSKEIKAPCHWKKDNDQSWFLNSDWCTALFYD
ncbi:uncharacterized protein LOC123531706 isoform X1 [Mercenaria mercenaria]|uniref:uncharacterized protein LOC123531706 isoform X1 n=1 Tax=Mercenaria mercenaria TaxID=6596 RepID=UPI00234E413B|nr:uncharacterized protein LOC123531706 isoform X1 [Mercenaria mercenaria]